MKEQFNEEYSSFFNEEMHGPSDEEDGDCYQQLSRELLLQNLELCIQTLGSDELIAISERYSTEPLQSIMHETMRRTIYLCVLILKWVKYFVKNDQRKAANSTEARMKIMYDMSNYSYFLVWTKQNLVWNF
ncbi:hypothetical protein EV182_000167 [Spiromyces aspiralis]|uniref:Uncharacterized protein n=1 Tax=Spiromyces aspiralis TaxID=68401 RepID=A0ACC1HHN9_9FUNG|nr:hypothetical protein EV182_000167 [Spiromyces aspiralis]